MPNKMKDEILLLSPEKWEEGGEGKPGEIQFGSLSKVYANIIK